MELRNRSFTDKVQESLARFPSLRKARATRLDARIQVVCRECLRSFRRGSFIPSCPHCGGRHYRGATGATTVASRKMSEALEGGGDAALLSLWHTAGGSVESAVV